MHIIIPGAGGNVGRGLAPRLLEAGHELTLADVRRPPGLPGDARFVKADVRAGEGPPEAMAGADVLVHLPAWHGVHIRDRSESEFWELNVDGTFRALQAAVGAGIHGVVWPSSQSWHHVHDQYGFTKVIGEQLLDYHRARHGISYVAVRPASFVLWTDWVSDYGRGLLYERVDREDVLDSIQLSVEYAATHTGGLIVDALHPDVVSDSVLRNWKNDPVGTAERLFPGARAVVERFGLDISALPEWPRTFGWSEIGYSPKRHFGAWISEVTGLADGDVFARRSAY